MRSDVDILGEQLTINSINHCFIFGSIMLPNVHSSRKHLPDFSASTDEQSRGLLVLASLPEIVTKMDH